MGYSFQSDGYESPELSILSEHLTRPGIKEFDFAQNPDGILWTLMNDGTFAGFTYLKSQEIQGWHRHSTQGKVTSICTIETDDGSEVWFSVVRNGATRIEKMAKIFEGFEAKDEGCLFLDSCLTYSGPPLSAVSGLEHLEGMKVSILGDGQHLTDQVVTGGIVQLDIPASRIVVGLSYEWKVVPLRLEGGSPTGFSQGKMKSVNDIVVRVERTAGISHSIKGGSIRTDLPARKFGENFDEAVKLISGDLQIKLNNAWNTSGQFELSGSAPLPVTILMIAAKVTINE